MNGGDFSMLELFREEVRAQTATLSRGLLELEQAPARPERVEPLMRAAHSVKGAARIVNIDLAVQLAHAMEDVLVAAQQGRVTLGGDSVDVLLRGTDLLAGLAQITEDGLPAWAAGHQADVDELKKHLKAIGQGQAPVSAAPAAQAARAAPARQVVIAPTEPLPAGGDFSMLELFREEVRAQTVTLSRGLLELEQVPARPERVEPLMRAAHSVKGAARIVNIDPAVQLAHAMEDVLVAAQQGRVTLGADSVDILLRGTDLLAGLAQVSEDGLPAWTAAHQADVEELKNALRAHLQGPPPALRPAEVPPKPAVAVRAPAEAPQPEVAPPGATTEPAEAVVRVTAQSLNRLMGLAGESLVQARWLPPFATSLLRLKKYQDRLAGLLDGLAEALAEARPAEQVEALLAEAREQAGRCRQVLGERIGEFEDHAAGAEDLNSRLYHEVIVSRMRPFADGAHGFPRLVRDMARRLDKQVRLEIEGQNTEVDRDILDKLEAPLTHLLRNAVDHGIEAPEERRAAGKPETGTVRVEARHRAGMLVITVSDDGAGVSLDRLRKKVVERGLTTPELAGRLGEAELLEFLFLPGFTTAPALTEFSGRGVGLDVVHTTLRKVGGSVRVSTRPGQGTSFHLQLPITLSVLRAVLVDVAGEPYAFPHNRIDRLLRVPRSAIRSLENRQFVTVDGHNVGLVLAAQLLELPGEPPGGEELPVVLLSDHTGHYGLIVESFRGEQDLVVRPLDARLGKVPNLSAAALLDDGTPVLIADVEDMVRSMDQYIQGGSLRRCDREAEAPEARRKRVLVVDDSITVREVERQLLRNHGYDVAVAVDGQEGWNMVRAGYFDLVVSDVDMPRMNGLDLVRAMRNN
jgi:two-component system sensor histidine kinase and response regulator WspE